MSIKLMTMAWELDIPVNMKLLLLKLADRANDDGECWPGQESLGKQCCLSERALRDNLKRLQEAGLIEVVHRRVGNRVKTNLYRLTFDNSQPADSAGSNSFQPADCDISNRQPDVTLYKEESSVEPSVCVPSKCSATKTHAEDSITFDTVVNEFRGITESQFSQWESIFKKIDVITEIEKAEAWLTVNPRKRKKNYDRFLHNWFSRASDRMTKPAFTNKPAPGALA